MPKVVSAHARVASKRGVGIADDLQYSNNVLSVRLHRITLTAHRSVKAAMGTKGATHVWLQILLLCELGVLDGLLLLLLG
jgi:hypothetical protein